jgi:hypothetical protein
MTKRERTLVIAVGAVLAVLGCLLLGKTIYDAAARRSATLANLQLEKTRSDAAFQRGLRYAEQLQAHSERALPANTELARSLYKNWLTKTVSEIGLSNVAIDPLASRRNGDVYELHPFTVTAIGDLEQITKLLYEIYATDLLHRIQRISLRPIRDKRELDLSLTLEVLSMPTAPERSEIQRDAAALFAGRSRESFEQSILGRNLFAPENKAPLLEVSNSYTAVRGQPFELVAKAADPNKLDQVSYGAEFDHLPGARFSEREGRLRWVPQENGEYKLVVLARDDGFPQRTARKEVSIRVSDPPKPADPPPKVSAEAKMAVVTGITTVNGRPEVWLTLRNKDRTLKLTVGDQFQVGEMRLQVSEIHGKQVVFDSGGQKISARLGESLVK